MTEWKESYVECIYSNVIFQGLFYTINKQIISTCPNQTCQRQCLLFGNLNADSLPKPSLSLITWRTRLLPPAKNTSSSAFEVCNESTCWIGYIHCAFGAAKDTEVNNICASGSELYYLRKLLKNKMHQVEKQFHQKCEGKTCFIHLFCKVLEQVFRRNNMTLT